MLEKIEVLVKYVQKKVNYEIEEASTGSVYLYINGKVAVRISNHASTKSQGVYTIRVYALDYDKGYFVEINRHIYYYTSYRKVGDLLIHKYYMEDVLPENNIYTKFDSANAQIAQLNNKVSSLEDKLNSVKTEKENLNSAFTKLQKDFKLLETSDKSGKYLEELKTMQQKASEYKQTISNLTDENKNLKKDCEEAADLITKLTTDPELREMLTVKGKKYFIDNFPEDVQPVLMDVIKEYYGK